MMDSSKSKKDWALLYVRNGYPVFPLAPNSKSPHAGSNGLFDATLDEDQIMRWWAAHPDSNIGVKCEALFAFDIDLINGQEQVLEQYMEENGVKLPNTVFEVRTPKGGKHLYFRDDGFFKHTSKSNQPINDCDIKAGGQGYVVGIGSVINGVEYSALKELPHITDLLTVPAFLSKVALKAEAVKPHHFSDKETSVKVLHESLRDVDTTRLIDYLKRIDPDCSYDVWRNATHAALNVFGHTDDVIELLEEWSKKGLKYDQNSINKLIESHNPNNPPPLTEGTLRYYTNSADKYKPKRQGETISIHIPVAFKELADQLIFKSFSFAIQLMEIRGQELTEEHRESIRQLCEYLVRMMFCEDQIRVAIPFETGIGKTTCVKGLILALNEMDITDIGLIVTTYTLNEVYQLRAELVELGVQPEKLGILRSDNPAYTHIEAIPENEAPNTQVLLLAQNRICFGRDAAKFMSFRGGRRGLVIWDERMISTESGFLSIEDICGELGRLEHLLRRKPNEEIQSWVKSLRDVLNTECNTVVELPKPPTTPLDYSQVNNLRKLAKLGAKEIALKQHKGGDILVWFRDKVPNEFTPMVVLDAGAGTSYLSQLDDSLTLVRHDQIKNYAQVVLHVNAVRASKAHVGKRLNFQSFIRELEYLLEEVVPKKEKMLIVTYKDANGRQCKEEVISWKESLGEDADRVEVINWGEHRATNDYSEIKYVFLLGVMYRDERELLATIVGQSRDLTREVTQLEIQNALNAEQADLIIQAINRGNARNSIDGKAGEMHVFLNHPSNQVVELVQQSMPGVRTEKYSPVHIRPNRRKDGLEPQELFQRALNYLAEFEGTLISIQKLRREIYPEGQSNDREWRNAMQLLQDHLPTGWIRKAGTLYKQEDELGRAGMC